MTSQLFATPGDAKAEAKKFGWRYGSRYHMPVLPGEATVKRLPKGWEPYVPNGLQSVTNMLDGFEDSRGLNIWEQEQFVVGMVMQPSLYEEASILVHRGRANGVDFSRLRDFPEVRKAITGGWDREAAEVSLLGRAKQAAGANEARQMGTNRHEAWEHFCRTGEVIGTPEIQEQVLVLVRLLEKFGFEIIPDLTERVVRNTTVNTAGRFDNILFHRPSGRLMMGDLKTKRRAFRSWSAVFGQLWCYAASEYMLDLEGAEKCVPYRPYVEGPLHHVDQKQGVVLVSPSDGAKPYLRWADLEHGRDVALHARRTLELRAIGKSVETDAASVITDEHRPVTS